MYSVLNIPFFYNIFWGEKGQQGLCKESVGKTLSSCVTHLIFVSKANNFLYHWSVIIVSVASFNENFPLLREIKDNEDRRETTEWTA